MTKKDFELIARTLRRTQPMSQDLEPHHFDQWADDVRAIADALATTNPRFDRTRFLFACAAATSSINADLQTARILTGVA